MELLTSKGLNSPDPPLGGHKFPGWCKKWIQQSKHDIETSEKRLKADKLEIVTFPAVEGWGLYPLCNTKQLSIPCLWRQPRGFYLKWLYSAVAPAPFDNTITQNVIQWANTWLFGEFEIERVFLMKVDLSLQNFSQEKCPLQDKKESQPWKHKEKQEKSPLCLLK